MAFFLGIELGHNTFLISDTHFGHAGMLEFKDNDGVPLRPFKNVEEMDETMVDNWNRVVRPEDRVYHIGDVVINRRFLPIMNRLKGRKKLIRGNHDLFKLKDYAPYFEDFYGCYVLKDMILTHIPIHPDCLIHRFGTNVHGHLHSNVVCKPNGTLDTKYISVCVEKINYTPISIDDLRKRIAFRQP